MATKIKLGSRPKHFKRVVEFDMLDGERGCIEVTYKYRTRSEFASLVDGMISSANSDAEAPQDDKPFSLVDVFNKATAGNVAYLKDIVDGWNLDVAFDDESAQQLADELPAATSAIIEGYRAAITEGRLGN